MTSPLDWTIPVTEIGEAGRGEERSANSAEREAVAKTLAILSCDQLTASYEVKPMGSGRYRLTGDVEGDVTQSCIVTLDPVWITANFKETQLEHVRPGQRVTVKVDAYGGRTLTGRVDSIAAATGARFSLLPPENATGNFVKVVQRVPVKIVLDQGQDPRQLLRPGMSVTPTVETR